MKKAAIKIIIVVVMTAALLCNCCLYVSANESVNISSYSPWYIPSNNPSGDFVSPPSNKTFYSIYYGWIIVLPIEIGYDYIIEIDWQTEFVNAQAPLSNLYKFALTESTTSINRISDTVFNNTNSNATNYVDTIESTYKSTSNNRSLYINFSTTPNNIDNITPGNKKIFPVYQTDTSVANRAPTSITVYAQKVTSDNIDTQILNKLDDIITNQEDWVIIYQNSTSITNNHLNNINNNIENIYNAGEGNTIPNNGSTLDQAQQQLHQSEDALTNKSDSLASRAAAGINTAKTSSTQFIGTITPAVSTVTGTVTQAIESLPQEIQPIG